MGDLVADGVIDMQDVFEMLTGYGAYEGDAMFEPAADLNNNGCIDLADLQLLLMYYSSMCP